MEDIIAKEGQELNFLPVGNYQAVCFDIWDIGIQEGSYEGKPNSAHKIIIGWEVDEKIESQDDYNGKRYKIYGWYTLSLGKKSNLRRDLTSWRGKEFTAEELKGFKINKLLGANCMLNVIHQDNGKPKVSAVTSVPKNLPKIDPETVQSTPEWVKKFQNKAISEQEAAALKETPAESAVDDEIGF